MTTTECSNCGRMADHFDWTCDPPVDWAVEDAAMLDAGWTIVLGQWVAPS
jgi:hypothetical protein